MQQNHELQTKQSVTFGSNQNSVLSPQFIETIGQAPHGSQTGSLAKSTTSSLFLEDDLRKSTNKRPHLDHQQLNEMQLLRNQVGSLNQVIKTLEKSLFNKAPNQINDEPNLSVLCERWRQKVFDTLVVQKRFELIAHQNLNTYTRNTRAMKS